VPEKAYSRSLKERQKRQREELILQCAEEVLLEKGYHDMSMDEIAARVGIAKGTVYLHFAKKEDLVHALLDREMLSVLQMIETAKTMDGTVRARLETILRSLYPGLSEKRDHLLYQLFSESDIRMATHEKHSAVMHEVSMQVKQLLEEGKARGEFRAEVPTRVMLLTFFSLLSARAYKRTLKDWDIEPEVVVDNIAGIYFRGIAADKPEQHAADRPEHHNEDEAR